MKTIKHTLLLAVMMLLCAGHSRAAESAKTPQKPWRSGWLFFSNKAEVPKIIEGAKALHLNALVFLAPEADFTDTIKQVRDAGLEAYYWFGPQLPGPAHQQVLRPKEKEVLKELLKDEGRFGRGYQGGGEPLPGQTLCPDKPMCGKAQWRVFISRKCAKLRWRE